MAITYTYTTRPFLDSENRVEAWAITYNGTDGTYDAIMQIEIDPECRCTLHPADQDCWTQERLSQFVAATYEDSGVELQLQKGCDLAAQQANELADFDPSALKES